MFKWCEKDDGTVLEISNAIQIQARAELALLVRKIDRWTYCRHRCVWRGTCRTWLRWMHSYRYYSCDWQPWRETQTVHLPATSKSDPTAARPVDALIDIRLVILGRGPACLLLRVACGTVSHQRAPHCVIAEIDIHMFVRAASIKILPSSRLWP